MYSFQFLKNCSSFDYNSDTNWVSLHSSAKGTDSEVKVTGGRSSVGDTQSTHANGTEVDGKECNNSASSALKEQRYILQW